MMGELCQREISSDSADVAIAWDRQPKCRHLGNEEHRPEIGNEEHRPEIEGSALKEVVKNV